MFIWVFVFLVAFVFSFVGTELFRCWSLKRGVLFDIPNERSSHKEPTPRGGGIVFVLICFLGFLIYGILFSQSTFLYFSFISFFVGLVSLLDDFFSLPVWIRFLAHILAASLLIVFFGYTKELYVPIIGEIYLGYLGLVVTFLWVVWVINAYNFMDGIDGIAAMQALVAAGGWISAGIFLENRDLIFLSGIIMASVLGFLAHNWSPAKIFMGDVGSAFLGFCFAGMPLLAANLQNVSRKTSFGLLFTLAVFFLFVFIFDTIFTLFRRILRREKIWKAHRTHIYQRLVISGLSHKEVTILYAIMAFLAAAASIFSIFFRQSELILVVLCVFIIFCLLGLVYRVEKAASYEK